MTRLLLLLPLLLVSLPACAPEASVSGAPPADTGDAYRRRDDAGWSPCVGARPAGCGRCPAGQNALWRRKADGSIEAACFDESTGEKVGTPRLRRVGGDGVPVDDNGREVGG